MSILNVFSFNTNFILYYIFFLYLWICLFPFGFFGLRYVLENSWKTKFIVQYHYYSKFNCKIVKFKLYS